MSAGVGAVPAPPLSSPAQRWGIAISLLTALTFGGSLAGEYVWDDTVLIRDNAQVKSLSRLGEALTEDFWHTSDPGVSTQAGFFRPVVKAAFVVEYALFSGTPFGFKLVNLMLHLVSGVLAFRWLMRRLAPHGLSRSALSLTAAVATLPFAVHPSRPESVAWISGSTDLWMTFWVLLGLEAWDHRRSGRSLALACAAFALALFSKEAAVVVPAMLAADALFLPSPGVSSRSRWRGIGAVAATLAVAMGVRVSLVPVRYSAVTGEGPSDLVMRVLATLGLFLERLALPLHPSVEVGALAMGTDGKFVYPSLWVAAGALGAIALVALAAAALKGKALRPWSADAVWFLAPLLPVLNVVPLKYKMLGSERFLYLPMLGICAWVGRAGASGWVQRGRWRAALLGFSALLTLGWALQSAAHVEHFQSDLSLWGYERQQHPQEPYAADMYARALWQESQGPEALASAADAVKLSSGDDDRARSAVLWASIRQALTRDEEQPVLLELRGFLDALADPAEPPATLTVAGAPLAFRPTSRERAKLLAAKGFAPERAILHARTFDLEGAERQFRDILEHSPERPSSVLNLARLLATEERFAPARQVLAEGRARLGPLPSFDALGRLLDQFESRLAAASGASARAAARAWGLGELGATGLAARVLEGAPAQPDTADTGASPR